MGLFNKLFNSSDASEENEMPWNEITQTQDLDLIEEQSKNKMQVIFKHSTRCGISKMVLGRFKKSYQLSAEQADLYYLDLLAHRGISLEIAERFQIRHESPQLLLIKNGVAIADESHGAINNMVLEDFL